MLHKTWAIHTLLPWSKRVYEPRLPNAFDVKTRGMRQQFLAQHKQDCISLSSMASSLAAQTLAGLQERKKKKLQQVKLIVLLHKTGV